MNGMNWRDREIEHGREGFDVDQGVNWGFHVLRNEIINKIREIEKKS